jgi:acyl carrier protein
MPSGSIQIGHRVFVSYGAAIFSQTDVRIADDTRLGPFAVIMDSDFHVVGNLRAYANARTAPVAVGRGVIIGSRVTILRGSDIGDGAVIRSGSVVAGRVAEGAVVGGVPARSITETEQDGHDVATVVMRVFGLASLPEIADGPAEIPQWDSLGALNLFVALEESLGIELRCEDVARARSVASLTEVVESARRSRK